MYYFWSVIRRTIRASYNTWFTPWQRRNDNNNLVMVGWTGRVGGGAIPSTYKHELVNNLKY